MSTKSVVTGIVLFAVGAGAGYGVGYFLTKKRIEAYIDTEIESVKEQYALKYKDGAFSTPEGAVDALIPSEEQVVEIVSQVADILEANGYTNEDDASNENLLADSFNDALEVEVPPAEQEIQTKNVWDEHGNDVADEEVITEEEEPEDEDFDTTSEGEPPVPDDEKIFPRTGDHPYVISEWQYMHDGENVDSKESLLYFEGDETLVDEHETLIPNIEFLVGNANLHRFGEGARSKDTLYIRNEKTEADYEIIRDKRNFTEVVLGIKPAKSAPLRMRNDDQ